MVGKKLVKIPEYSCAALEQTRERWEASLPKKTWEELMVAIGLARQETGHWIKLCSITNRKNTFLVKDNQGNYLGMIEVGCEETRAALEALVNTVIARSKQHGSSDVNESCKGCSSRGTNRCLVKKIEKISN